MTVKLEELEAESDQAAEELFLSPDAVPRRHNQMLALGLVLVAILVLATVVTLTMLIHYDHMPSLLSYFT
jgi:hypothetical protein